MTPTPSSTFTYTGPGCPIHRAGPSQFRIRAILEHTGKDIHDSLYYRCSVITDWQRLITQRDYDDLNLHLQYAT